MSWSQGDNFATQQENEPKWQYSIIPEGNHLCGSEGKEEELF